MDIKEHFEQFKGMKPYLRITKSQWSYIKKTFPILEVKEILADLCME
jgi:hypothetical protein